MPSINPRTILPFIILPAIGALLGIYVQNSGGQWVKITPVEPNWTVVAAVAGAALWLAFFLVWQRWPRQVTIIALTHVFLLSCFVLIGLLPTLLTALAVVLVLFASTMPLSNLYGVNSNQAFLYHMRVWLTSRGGAVVVDNGRIIAPGGAGPHFGPRFVVIRPGNAVVMTMGARVSRMCGPSTFLSRNFEYVSQVLPLAKRRHTLAVANVLTCDQLPVDVYLSYIYSIGASDDTNAGLNANLEMADGSKGLTAFERGRLWRLISFSPDWEQDIRLIIEGAVHNEIGSYDYDELLTFTNYQQIARRIVALASARIWQLGADLQSVAVSAVAPRVEVIDALTEGERVRTQQTAEAQGFRAAVSTAAAGYRTARQLGMTPDEIRREVARQTMEHMAEDPATKVILPPLS